MKDEKLTADQTTIIIESNLTYGKERNSFLPSTARGRPDKTLFEIPHGVMRNTLAEKHFLAALHNRKILGSVEEPHLQEPYIRLKDAAFLITHITLNKECLLFSIELLTTPKGKALKNYIREHCTHNLRVSFQISPACGDPCTVQEFSFLTFYLVTKKGAPLHEVIPDYMESEEVTFPEESIQRVWSRKYPKDGKVHVDGLAPIHFQAGDTLESRIENQFTALYLNGRRMGSSISPQSPHSHHSAPNADSHNPRNHTVKVTQPTKNS